MSITNKDEPDRHHFVPVVLLEGFVNAAGVLYAWRRDNGRIWPSKPKGVFFERGLNTLMGEDGSRDVSLERAYRPLEGVAGRVLPKIRRIADGTDLPGLDHEERGAFDEFYIHQFARLPATMDRVFERSSPAARLEHFNLARTRGF